MKRPDYKWTALSILRLGIVVGSRLGDRLVKRIPTVRFWIIGGGMLLGAPFIYLMIAFLFGCFSPTVLGWTKEHYSMSAGLSSLALAYAVGFVLLVVACRRFAVDRSNCRC